MTTYRALQCDALSNDLSGLHFVERTATPPGPGRRGGALHEVQAGQIIGQCIALQGTVGRHVSLKKSSKNGRGLVAHTHSLAIGGP